MKKLRLFIMMLMAAMLPLASFGQESLTIHDGTTTNSYVPMFVSYFDDFTRSHVVYPASELEDMVGGQITAITFYCSSNNMPYTTLSTVDIYLTEVAEETVSAFIDKSTATLVYQGTVSFESTENGGMGTITFDTPYTYNGGNLLFGCDNTTDAGYKFVYFYGETVNGASYSGYNGTSLASVTSGTQRDFLPKTTFTYTAGGPVSCARPTNLAFSDLTSNSVSLAWTAGGTETEWTLLVNDTEVSGIATNPYTLENLTPATDYTVKVKAVCAADDESNWSNTISFTTACETFNVTENTPYQESFDGTTFPPTCWSNVHSAGSSTSLWLRNIYTTHNSSAGSASLYYQSTGNKVNLVTGNVNIPEANTYQVSLWMYRNYTSYVDEGVKVWVNTTPDTVGGTPIIFIHRAYDQSPVEAEGGWYQYEAVIPTSGDMYVIFEAVCGNGFAMYIDDISIEKAPTCLKPSEVAAANVTAYSAEISWTDNNNTDPANGWLLLVNDEEIVADANPFTLSDLTPETDYTVIVRSVCSDIDSSDWSTASASFTTLPSCPAPTALTVVENSITTTGAQISWTAGGEEESWIVNYNDTEIPVTENPYTFTDLTPGTLYTVKVKAVCSETDSSQWTNTVNFATECATIVVTEENAFAENFNTLTSGIPLCWDNEDGTTTTDSYKWNYYYSGYTGACVKFNSYNNSSDNTNMLKTPVLDVTALATPRVTFMYKNPTGGDFSVFVSTDGGETYTTELASGLTGADSWTPMAITLDNLASTDNVVIVFQGTSNWGNGDANIYLDNVVVEETPACLAPTDLTLDTVTTTYFQVSWTDNNENTPESWTVAYSIDGGETFTEINDIVTDSAVVCNFEAPLGDVNVIAKVKANCTAESASAWSETIDFVTPPTCPVPTGLETTSVGTNSVTLSWTAGGEETQWIVLVNGIESDIVTENPLTIDTLTADTDYSIRVRAFCAEADSSVWSNTVSFYTGLCIPAPYSVDNNGITNVTFGQTQVVNNSTHPSASPYFGDYTAQVGDGAASTVVTVDVTYATSYTYGTVIWVNWNNDVEFTDDEVVYAGTSLSTNPTTLSCTFTIPASTPVGNYRMRIGGADNNFDNAISNGSGYNPCLSTSYTIYEDYTLAVTEAPSCMAPADLTATDITENSATIDWTDNSECESWIFNINGTDTVVTSHPVVLNDLTANTAYTVKVMAVCSETDTSDWSVEYSFRTSCGIITANGYSEDFSEYTATASAFSFGMMPFCWSYIYSGLDAGAEPHVYNGYSAVTQNDNCLIITSGAYDDYWYETEDYGTTNYAVMPEFDNLAGLQLNFSYKTSSYGTLTVGYLTDVNETSTFVQLESIPTATTVSTYELNVSDVPAGVRLAFSWTYSSSTNYYSCYIDDITIVELPSCFKPTAVTVTGIGTSTATIDWTDGNEETPQSWTINLNGVDTVVTEHPVTLADLASATEYTIKVKANCTDDDESDWSAESTFTTACDVVVVTDATPYNEGFESADNCWTDEDNYWTYGTNYNYTAHQGASYVYFSGNSFEVYTGKLVSPIFDITGVTTPYLSFAHAQKAWDSDQNILRVFYRASASEEWTLLVDYTSDITDWQEEEIALPNPSATYQIAFEGEAHYGYPVAVDDVNIFNYEEATPCATPTDVAVDNGVVTWTGDAANYNVVITVEGDTAINTTVNTNSYTIEGLNEGDHAIVTVQAVCSEDDLSDWSEGVEFDYTGTGISSYNLEANIYPNPTTGNVTVESNAINADITVFDMFGKLMMTSKIASERTELNFSNFAPGVYTVRIANATGISTIKVVKE